jgi:hypothetical protein
MPPHWPYLAAQLEGAADVVDVRELVVVVLGVQADLDVVLIVTIVVERVADVVVLVDEEEAGQAEACLLAWCPWLPLWKHSRQLFDSVRNVRFHSKAIPPCVQKIDREGYRSAGRKWGIAYARAFAEMAPRKSVSKTVYFMVT